MNNGLAGGLTGEQLFWVVIAALGGLTILAAVTAEYFTARLKANAKIEQARVREESRREIAAYVAEGSISPDDAAKLLAAGPGSVEGIKSTIRECIESSAEAARHFSGRQAREHARAAARPGWQKS